MNWKQILAALTMVLIVAVTTAAVTTAPPVGMFYSSDGSGNPGTWVAMSGSGTPYTGTVQPAGMFVSSDGSGNPGTWVAATAATFGGISGQTVGYLPKATSATGSTTSSAIDDGQTLAGAATVHEAFRVLVDANNTFQVGGNCGPILASFCFADTTNTSAGQAILGLTGGAYNANVGIYMGQFNPTQIRYWGMGMFANDVNISWTLEDILTSRMIIQFPGNTMPAQSITGNANGPVLLRVQTPAARNGTFVCTAGGTITISNTNQAATSNVVISLNVAGGTITTPPAMKTVTAGTGFTVLCGASDTSTYNYNILN